MSCKEIIVDGNIGFICTSSYILQEEKWWQEHLVEYKEAFINHMISLKVNEEIANAEYESHLENVGVDDLSTPEQDAEDCLSYWEE